MMDEAFPNLMKNLNLQSKKFNEPQVGLIQRTTPRYILVKLKLKDKKKILKAARQKSHTWYKNVISSDFPSKLMEVRRHWNSTCEVLKENCQSRILYFR